MSDIPYQESGGEGSGGWALSAFFWCIKLTCGKACLGGGARYHPLYVSAEGSVLKIFITLPLIFMAWVFFVFVFFSACLNCDDLNHVIKESKRPCVVVQYGATCWHTTAHQERILVFWILFFGDFMSFYLHWSDAACQRWTQSSHCSRYIIYTFYPDNIAFKSENTKS